MKKYFIALLAILSLSQLSFIPIASAQNPRVTIPDFADLVEKASPAVVNIRTTEKVVVQQAQGGIPGMPEDQAEFFRRFFGVPIPGVPSNPARPAAGAWRPVGTPAGGPATAWPQSPRRCGRRCPCSAGSRVETAPGATTVRTSWNPSIHHCPVAGDPTFLGAGQTDQQPVVAAFEHLELGSLR